MGLQPASQWLARRKLGNKGGRCIVADQEEQRSNTRGAEREEGTEAGERGREKQGRRAPTTPTGRGVRDLRGLGMNEDSLHAWRLLSSPTTARSSSAQVESSRCRESNGLGLVKGL